MKQEPVAEIVIHDEGERMGASWAMLKAGYELPAGRYALYTSPAPVQAQPEPVAWMRKDGMKAMVADEKSAWIEAGNQDIVGDYTLPLFTHPAPVQQEPVGKVIRNGVIKWAGKYPDVGTELYAAPVQQNCNCADQTDCDGKCCKPVQELPNLYSITGDIKDINTLLVPRSVK